jgi:hypothetical protein
MASWLDRIRVVGNGQVPAVAALAWEILHMNDETRMTANAENQATASARRC